MSTCKLGEQLVKQEKKTIQYIQDQLQHVPQEIAEKIMQCLLVNPKKRISCYELSQEFPSDNMKLADISKTRVIEVAFAGTISCTHMQILVIHVCSWQDPVE